MEFSSAEKKILHIVQGDLPDTLRPYDDIGAKCGVSGEYVIDFLSRLKNDGIIRRFGATLRHQRAGWSHNAMVAWIATQDEADQYGPIAARQPGISHAYYRPSPGPEWPYSLYTMIHGRTREECLKVAEDLKSLWPLDRYAILESVRELKKTSMIYFP